MPVIDFVPLFYYLYHQYPCYIISCILVDTKQVIWYMY